MKIVSIDLDKVIPELLTLVVDIHGKGLPHTDAVRIVQLLEDAAEEPKEGRWLFSDYGGIRYYQCSCCDYELEIPLTYTKDDVKKYRKYCTKCGAKMSEEY